MSVRQGKLRAATSRLLPMVPLGGAIIAMLLVVANCSDRPPARRWRVTPHKADPVKRRSSAHPSHEHGHGPHPHDDGDHHHHPHPHPHLAGSDGHHHPY